MILKQVEDIAGLQELVAELLGRITVLEASHARLEAETVQLRAETIQLREENAHLREENARLKGQLNQDSHNSHRPPSSEGYRKKPALPMSKQRRRRGGVRGHKGSTLCQVETPDEVVALLVELLRSVPAVGTYLRLGKGYLRVVNALTYRWLVWR